MRFALHHVLNVLRFLRNPVRNFREVSAAKKFLLAAWTVIGALFATVMHFTTGAAWGWCVGIAAVMAGFSGAVAAVMCQWSDQRAVPRTRLIIFFGVGLALMLLTISLRGSRFDPTSVKLFVFSFAGMVVTAFFMPRPSKPAAGAATR